MTYLPQGRFSLSFSLSLSHTHTHVQSLTEIPDSLFRCLTEALYMIISQLTPTHLKHTHTHTHSQISLCIEFQGQAGLPISIVMTSRRMFEICLLVIKIVEKTNDYVFALIRNRPLLSFSKSSLVR